MGHRCYPFWKQPGAGRQPGNQWKNRCRATGQIVPGLKEYPSDGSTDGFPDGFLLGCSAWLISPRTLYHYAIRYIDASMCENV